MTPLLRPCYLTFVGSLQRLDAKRPQAAGSLGPLRRRAYSLVRSYRSGEAAAQRDGAVDGGDLVEDGGVLGLEAGNDRLLRDDRVAVDLLGALQRPQCCGLGDDL